MYSFIVVAAEGAWDADYFDFPRDRFLEYTERAVAAQLNPLNEAAVNRLTSIPVILAYEAGVPGSPKLTSLTQIERRSATLRLHHDKELSIRGLNFADLQQFAADLDIRDFEFRRVHWAVKDVDLNTILHRMGIDATALTATSTEASAFERENSVRIYPRLFRIPQASVHSAPIAVMMPFDGAFSSVYEAIALAAKEEGMECKRADDIWEDSTIIQDIFSLIYRSKVVVADLTGQNPNVMYEIGIAHTLGREVIPISQESRRQPFDLQHHRILSYHPNREGLEELKNGLKRRIRTLFAQ